MGREEWVRWVGPLPGGGHIEPTATLPGGGHIDPVRLSLSLATCWLELADLLTKVLDDETFKRHRATIMNLKAKP